MEEPDRLQSMGLQRVRHDWATSLSFFFPGEELHEGCMVGDEETTDLGSQYY